MNFSLYEKIIVLIILAFKYIFDKIGIETKGYLRKQKRAICDLSGHTSIHDINCLHYVNFQNFFGRD